MTEITITFERDVAPRERDFKVLINGEHRANFRSRRRYSQAGYDLQTADGQECGAYDYRYMDSVKANFEEIVRKVLPKIPTLAQIERYRLQECAEKENRERDSQIAAHRAQVRRNVLREALSNYPSLGARDAEHLEMAKRMLEEMSR
jgi:hypothetical protein